MGDICQYTYKDHGQCLRPGYEGADRCVFHFEVESGGSEEKKWAGNFRRALKKYMDECSEDHLLHRYDFRGFVFPDTDLSGRKFKKILHFGDCNFLGNVIFRGSTFQRDVIFKESSFDEYVDFDECIFERYFSLQNCRVTGNLYLRKTLFQGNVNFQNAKFKGEVYLGEAEFQSKANFVGCNFFHYTDLGGVVFKGDIHLSESHITYTRNTKAYNVNFDGAILRGSRFCSTSKLEGYSFRNAILLSVSFEGLKVLNCDFTGAVMDTVYMRGWRPNRTTMLNTKHIYTNFDLEEKKQQSTFHPRCRVPLEGSFGDGEHQNFTIREYFKNEYHWSLSFHLPDILRVPALNYIRFYVEFLRVLENVKVELLSFNEGRRTRVEFVTEDMKGRRIVKEKLKAYIETIRKDFNSDDIAFRNSKVDSLEKELFKNAFASEVSGLRNLLLRMEEILNDSPQKSKEKNQLLLNSIERLLQGPADYLFHEGLEKS